MTMHSLLACVKVSVQDTMLGCFSAMSSLASCSAATRSALGIREMSISFMT